MKHWWKYMGHVQDEVRGWTAQYTPQYWRPNQILNHLAEEVGEVCSEINHIHGEKKRKPGESRRALGGEIADVVFALACLADSHCIDLQAACKDADHSICSKDPYELSLKLIVHTGKLAKHVLINDCRDPTSEFSHHIGRAGHYSYDLAVMHGRDLYKEFDKMMREKRYGRDANRFKKA